MANEFRGDDAWDQYLSRIEESSPRIEALGIRDYWSTDRYEEVRAYRDEGRLPDVALIFPNIEMRFGIGTAGGSAINAHLLVSPEDPEHVALTRQFLANLEFGMRGETYRCTYDDLVRLGRTHDSSVGGDDRHALAVGANQFKITVDGLRNAFDKSEWAQRNLLIGVVAGTGQGTSGLQSDASLTALRREIEGMAHVIFSSRKGDRDFWLGNGALSRTEVEAAYRGLKPCLHGSDAHALERVGAPDNDRFTWIKGDATFESLRQACIEPETRTVLGEKPPEGALTHQTMNVLALENASWCATPNVPLNPGLVGIIGARGSGKTALVDLIATAAESRESLCNERSFIRRASARLGNIQATLSWGDGTETETDLGSPPDEAEPEYVQYLSQQFVEHLCSSDGGGDRRVARGDPSRDL